MKEVSCKASLELRQRRSWPFMKSLLCLCLCLPLASCSNSMPRTSAKPPATKAEPVEETLHGVAITDRYRWLEGDNSDPADQGKVTPEVAGWTDAQNRYTRSVLDALPGRQALEARLRPLMEVGAVTRPIVRANRYFFSKREGNQNQPVVYWREGYKGESKVLIDPARLDESGLTTVEWFSPSQDGKLLAYGTYRAGDENTTLHLLEVDCGEDARRSRSPTRRSRPTGFPTVPGSSTRTSRTPRIRTPVRSCFTGWAPIEARTRSSSASSPKRRTPSWRPPGDRSAACRATAAGSCSATGSTPSRMTCGWWTSIGFSTTGKIDKTVVTVGADGQATGTVIDGTLFLQTTKGAPQGRIVAASAAQPEQAHWRDIVPERPDAVIESVSFGKGVIAVTVSEERRQRGGSVRLRAGRRSGVVSQPGIGAAAVAAEVDRTEAYLTFTSFNYPTTIFRVDLRDAAGRARALGAARRPGRSGDRGSRAGLVPVEGRHEDQHVPGAQEGPDAQTATRRRCSPATAASTSARRRRFRRRCFSGSRPAACTRCRTCAAAASTATPGTRPACSARSRTSSTTSLPRPSG